MPPLPGLLSTLPGADVDDGAGAEVVCCWTGVAGVTHSGAAPRRPAAMPVSSTMTAAAAPARTRRLFGDMSTLLRFASC
jgi:hypothetical protein